jgi:hypothetical protein
MEVRADQWPGGFANAEDEFIDEFDNEVDDAHPTDLTTIPFSLSAFFHRFQIIDKKPC